MSQIHQACCTQEHYKNNLIVRIKSLWKTVFLKDFPRIGCKAKVKPTSNGG